MGLGLSCKFGNFHRSFKIKWLVILSNVGNKLQMMVALGKECGFTSNFDIPRSFTPRKSELRPKIAKSQSDCRTHSGDEIAKCLCFMTHLALQCTYRRVLCRHMEGILRAYGRL